MDCGLYTRPSKLLNDAMGAVLAEFKMRRVYFMYITSCFFYYFFSEMFYCFYQ